ncbi:MULTISPECIES: hypothetical protein [Cyanophyceae]|uniref:hypothetical protein n=1 Tax=Cyanophyceae TaxID=3028117 RepID=UPI001683D880|nr:hypothetical protein [Trichocoleus sp. FACHB-40]MBD2003038.1 hypothetical protein [Trichocoleus sp. FACHB-40]
MTTFLERYKSGEYEQVWDELLARGSSIRNEPLLEDALAVARETMARTRTNIEILIEPQFGISICRLRNPEVG